MSTQTLVFTLSQFEKRYRADHVREHALLLNRDGLPVMLRTGDIDSVEFTQAELTQATGGTLSHSHPRALPPSGNDLAMAAEYGLTLRAVGKAPDTGQQFDYTLYFAKPNIPLSVLLPVDFDDEVERAERELSREPYEDLQWQREARHLAVSRLARKYGFAYQRVEKAALHEAARHEKRRLDVLVNTDTLIRREVLGVLRDSITRLLTRYAVHGQVPIANLGHLRTDLTALVQKVILGTPTKSGALQPYTVQRGEVIPRSLYFATVWGAMRQAAAAAIERHAEMMRKHLPEDLQRAFSMAVLSPFDESIHEMEEDRPLYDPLHLWIGPDQKQLSDRVWNVAGDMRRRLDTYLTSAIARGLPVEQIAKGLEPFLMEGKGSYEAMRLARTEVAYAYARADSASANANPFVDNYSFHTAPSHKCCDQCDVVEAGGPYPKTDVSHLPPQHPNCICTIVWHMVEDIKAVVNNLRDKVAKAITSATRSIADYIGPLSRRFLDLLFGKEH